MTAPPARPRKRRAFAASEAQRAKVRDQACANCGQGPCDPAHVTSRAQGGCDHPDCVLPLCRLCHTSFDTGRLDISAAMEPHFRRELAHAVEHRGLFSTLRRVTNSRWTEAA